MENRTLNAEYIMHMGTDDTIVDAARVSFAKRASQYSKEANERLIRRLAKDNHWSPFAHPQIMLRMTAPIAIRTQCFKHQAGFVPNEESRRYVKETPELFVPTFREKPDGSIKQGSGEELGWALQRRFEREYVEVCSKAIIQYNSLIAEGVAPEQARFVLPQGVYTQWIWTGSLAAYARFYKQRTDPHAQKEIQDLARMVGDIIQPLFPVAWEVLTGVTHHD